MSGMFPQQPDGGIPPNADTPLNPAQAYDPTTRPTGTNPLYYGNGCDVRLRPHVLNSLISETAALCDVADLAYDPARLINTQLATRYLIQRGKPRYALVTSDDGLEYTGVLDPPMTKHNNGMTLIIVPDITNTGPVRLNFGKGARSLVNANLKRTDIKAKRLLADTPIEIVFYDGRWYLVGAGGGAGGDFDVVNQPSFSAVTPLIGVPTHTGFLPGGFQFVYNNLGDAIFNTGDGIFRTGEETFGLWTFTVASVPEITMTNKYNITAYHSLYIPQGIGASNTSDINSAGGFSTHITMACTLMMPPGIPVVFTHMAYVGGFVCSVKFSGVRVAGGPGLE
ncbi:MAG: hypothetical protein C5B54_04110 [Acidobacteria bacterium]|nr:MAG: hypothetical protein C5B54_04110 [Acidobacteriota bacterium]